MATTRTKIFLCHSSADKELVREYKQTLEALGLEPWLDEDAMAAGVSLGEAIRKGVSESCAAVFFVSDDFEVSDYIAAEIDHAIEQKAEHDDQFALVTLFLGEEGAADKVPKKLRNYLWKEPKSQLEALREILRGLPLQLGSPRFLASELSAVRLAELRNRIEAASQLWEKMEISIQDTELRELMAYQNHMDLSDQELACLAGTSAHYGVFMAPVAGQAHSHAPTVLSLADVVAQYQYDRPAWRAAAMLARCAPDLFHAAKKEVIDGAKNEERRYLLESVIPEHRILAYLEGELEKASGGKVDKIKEAIDQIRGQLGEDRPDGD